MKYDRDEEVRIKCPLLLSDLSRVGMYQKISIALPPISTLIKIPYQFSTCYMKTDGLDRLCEGKTNIFVTSGY
jgi:hypothetical protein